MKAPNEKIIRKLLDNSSQNNEQTTKVRQELINLYQHWFRKEYNDKQRH